MSPRHKESEWEVTKYVGFSPMALQPVRDVSLAHINGRWILAAMPDYVYAFQILKMRMLDIDCQKGTPSIPFALIPEELL